MADKKSIQATVRWVARERAGLRRLAVALDCVNMGLIDAEQFSDFLEELAAEYLRRPEDRWHDVWERVCKGRSEHPSRTAGYMRTGPKPPDTGPQRLTLSTVVAEHVWRNAHVRPRTEVLCEDGERLPEYPLINDAQGRAAFDRLTARPDWYQSPKPEEGAWLGRPSAARSNCWISTPDVDVPHRSPPRHDDVEETIPRLGIWPDAPKESYIRYSLDSQELLDSGHGLGARPVFSDLGSSWFCVRSSGDVARHHGSRCWGHTYDLGAPDRPRHDDMGLPERVISAIPLSHPAIKGSELLMPANPMRKVAPPSQQLFDRSLFNGRKGADIVREVLILWKKGVPPDASA